VTALVLAVRDYAALLYALLVLFAVREVLVMRRTAREHDVALFGLEREAARGRMARSLVSLFLLFTIGMGVYTVATVVAPALPEDAARRAMADLPLVETPPTVMLPTETPTPPPATATRRAPRIVTAAPDATERPGGSDVSTLCRNPGVDLVAPPAGTVVTRATDVVATVRFSAGEGRSFWVELGAGADPTAWRRLGAARTEPVEAATVATVPGNLSPGPYVLRLVLAEASGEVLPDNTCAVPLRVP
jgi:hypothetical protein